MPVVTFFWENWTIKFLPLQRARLVVTTTNMKMKLLEDPGHHNRPGLLWPVRSWHLQDHAVALMALSGSLLVDWRPSQFLLIPEWNAICIVICKKESGTTLPHLSDLFFRGCSREKRCNFSCSRRVGINWGTSRSHLYTWRNAGYQLFGCCNFFFSPFGK